MTDKPEHPDGPASEQDQSLEAQLDALLDDLEAAEPQMVPKDLRKIKPEPTKPQPVAKEPAQPAPTPTPAQDEPKPAKKSLDLDEIAALASSMLDAQQAAQAETAQPQPAPPLEQVAAQDQPKPAKKSLDLDEIAALASSMLDNQIEQTIAAAKPKEADSPPAQPQPQAVEKPDKPAKKGLDLESIASMASNLLDKQINDMVAESAGANPAPPTALASDAESTATDTPAPGSDVTSKALGEDELSAQIQALLNHVQTQPDFGETGSAKDAPATAPDTHETKAPSSGAGAVSIDEIDAMLAESAEHAIQHEPQPVSEVPGTDEILAAQALDEDAQHPLDAQPAYQPQAEHEEPEPAPAPQPQLAPVATQSVGATADDVADELDQDDIPAPAKPAPAKAHRPDPHDALEPDAVTIHHSALKKTEKTLLRLCGKVNRPLNRLSPEMKDTVGYIGVVVLLPALCLILYGLVF